MAGDVPRYTPHVLEEAAAALWKNRRLPPVGGWVGRGDGPVLRQYVGAFADSDTPVRIAHRSVAADVDARFYALSGRRAVGTLRRVTPGGDPAAAPIGPLLGRLGVWVGGEGARAWDETERAAGRAAIVGRLARAGALVLRDAPFRVCPTCSTPRNPERIVYREEEGDTYLVRFPTRLGDRTVALVVWVDAPWRLLGTSALLVNPEFPYVVARSRHRDAVERVVTSRASLDRLRSWLPGVLLEVEEEVVGAQLLDLVYEYPLRHEFPMGGSLAPPAGTVQGAADVGESGTGIVPLVPGHGGTDAQVAERLKVPGWPLLTARGQLDLTLMHKYAGLDLATANDFVLRDLAEEGALYARLRVRRGVPHCQVCGGGLIWAPGRAWCLEPARLPREVAETYRRLLPRDPIVGQIEFAAWPVSESSTTDGERAVGLLECSRCERLEMPPADLRCACGGRRTLVNRRLLSSFEGAVSAWARTDPVPFGDAVRVYVNDRRRAPTLVHHLACASVVDGLTGEFTLDVLASIADLDLDALVTAHGTDAVRSALVRAPATGLTAATFTALCVQERARLSRWWSAARALADAAERSLLASANRPIHEALGELEPEDRAVLALWERVRAQAVADFERHQPGAALQRFHRFLESDFGDYRDWAAARLGANALAPSRRAAQRTLVHLLRSGAVLVAPVAPFTAEAVYRLLRPEATSVFEATSEPVDRALVDDAATARWDRWRTVLSTLDRFRRRQRIGRTTLLPMVVLAAATDELGDRLREDAATLARLARAAHLEVASPKSPWTGRRRTLRPIESEIQRAYPTQASQIMHLLQRGLPRASGESGELSVVIHGLPRTITPAMYEYVESLPAGVVETPWTGGSLYVELPGSADGATAGPPLSADAFWLTRRIAKRLRAARRDGIPAAVTVAVVATSPPLAEELARHAAPIAQSLGLAELRVVEHGESAPPPGRIVGRTRTGARWWVDLPGLPPAPRTPRRLTSPRRRMRIAVPSAHRGLAPGDRDFADLAQIAREEAVRALGQELDALLGAPLIGPAKVAGAWEGGVTSLEGYRSAPFDTLVAMPGFGRALTIELFDKLGRTVPPEARAPPPRRTARSAPPVAPAAPGTLVAPDLTAPVSKAETLRPPTLPPAPEPVETDSGGDGVAELPTPEDSVVSEPEVMPPTTSESVAASLPPPEPLATPLPPPESPTAPNTEVEVVTETDSSLPSVPVEGPVGGPGAAPADAGSEAERPAESAVAREVLPPEDPVPEAGAAAAAEPPLESGVASAPAADVSSVPEPAPLEAAPSGEAGGTATRIPAPEVEPAAPTAPDPATLAPPETAPAPAGSTAGVELRSGGSLVTSLQPFLDATAAGLRGLAIVRESPERIRAHAGGRPIEVYWLTNFGRGPSLRPGDLDALVAFLERALLDQGISVFFLEGVEYLIRLHGTSRVLSALVEFDRRLRERDGRAWVHLTPDLLSPGDLDQFHAVFG